MNPTKGPDDGLHRRHAVRRPRFTSGSSVLQRLIVAREIPVSRDTRLRLRSSANRARACSISLREYTAPVYAAGGTRTHTSRRTTPFEGVLSTHSSTAAGRSIVTTLDAEPSLDARRSRQDRHASALTSREPCAGATRSR